MSVPRRVIGAFAFFFTAALAAPALAIPFLAGDVLRATFDLSGLPASVSAPDGHTFAIPKDTDVFGASFFVGSGSGVNTFTARLYDGDRLLATQTIPAPPVLASRYGDYANFYFTSSSSLLGPFSSQQGTLVQPTVIDFSSFVNGSINGAVEFTMDSGQIDRRRRYETFLFLGHAVASNEAYGVRVFPHGESPTPEPASLLLTGTGLAGLWIKARRRLRAH